MVTDIMAERPSLTVAQDRLLDIDLLLRLLLLQKPDLLLRLQNMQDLLIC